MLVRGVKSKKTREQEAKELYASPRSQQMLADGDKLNQDHQDVADDAMRKAAKEGRGL